MMTNVLLQRVLEPAGAVFGVLSIDQEPVCVTLERSWMDNAPNISCIPHGVYVMQRIQSPRFGETFEVLNVRARSHIIFHAGNTNDDTKGCILPGTYFGELHSKPAVLRSSDALQELMQRLATLDSALLDIRWCVA